MLKTIERMQLNNELLYTIGRLLVMTYGQNTQDITEAKSMLKRINKRLDYYERKVMNPFKIDTWA